jgi:ketosteroid isomerase-like protein
MDTNATTDGDVKAIKRLGEEYFAATNAGDPDRCWAVMATDVIIMPPDRPSIVGKGEIRRLSHDYHATYELNYTLVYDEAEMAGICSGDCHRDANI